VGRSGTMGAMETPGGTTDAAATAATAVGARPGAADVDGGGPDVARVVALGAGRERRRARRRAPRAGRPPRRGGPYIVLGCGYASLAIGLLVVGAQRQRDLEQAMRSGRHVPLPFHTVGAFTVGGIALALMTVVLVIAQT
jgi:hypothetical protein